MSGMNACIGILASLVKKKETGLGQQIDISLVDSIVSALESKAMQYIYEGKIPEKTGNKYIASAPYDSFTAKDAYFVIASGTDLHFRALSAVMGQPELADNPLYKTTEDRQANSKTLKNIINKWASDKTVSECVDAILGAGVPAAPIYDVKDIYEDKNISEVREMFVKVNDPKSGELTVLGNPIKMSEYPCQYKTSAPKLGEHDDEIFEQLGYSKEKLDEYRAKGVII